MPNDLKGRIARALDGCAGRCLDDANDRAVVLAEVVIAVSPPPVNAVFDVDDGVIVVTGDGLVLFELSEDVRGARRIVDMLREHGCNVVYREVL